MNMNISTASIYLNNLNKRTTIHRNLEVIIGPALTLLYPLSLEIDHRKFSLAAQNGYFKDQGAFTGEVSFAMLKGLVKYAIIGHSERRIYFNEDHQLIRDKVAAATRNEIIPILCIGENKSERVANDTKRVVADQLNSALYNLTSDEVAKMVIAYEPVWAISTFGGEIPKPSDIQKVIDYIRFQISELYGAKVASSTRVLYGGSVNSDSITAYLALDGCDGALVGGASLNYLEFSKIIEKGYLIDKLA